MKQSWRLACAIVILTCSFLGFAFYKSHMASPANEASQKAHVPFAFREERPATGVKPVKKALSNTELVNKVNNYLENSENHADFQRNQHLRMARIQFNGVLARLSLNREDEDALMALLAEKSAATVTIHNASTRNEQHGKSISESAERALRGEIQGNLNSEIANLLGEEKYRLFVEYRQNFPFYHYSNSLIQSLAHTSDPITPGQVDKIAGLLSEHATSNEIRTSYYYDILLSASDDLITPAQKAHIARLQREEDEVQKLKTELGGKKQP